MLWLLNCIDGTRIHFKHPVIELSSRVCSRTAHLRQFLCSTGKGCWDQGVIQKNSCLTGIRLCSSVLNGCSEPVLCNGVAELWGLAPVSSFSKAHRSDVGSCGLMESLLIFLVLNNTVAFEGASTWPAWSLRHDMKAGVAQETQGGIL